MAGVIPLHFGRRPLTKSEVADFHSFSTGPCGNRVQPLLFKQLGSVRRALSEGFFASRASPACCKVGSGVRWRRVALAVGWTAPEHGISRRLKTRATGLLEELTVTIFDYSTTSQLTKHPVCPRFPCSSQTEELLPSLSVLPLRS